VFSAAIIAAGFAVVRAQDPGLPDSLIIYDIAIDSGDTSAIVPVFAVTDDPVAFFNMPLSVEALEGGFSVENVIVVSGQISLWDEVYSDYFPGDQFLRLLGISDTGGEDNPILNTDYHRTHILDLVFAIEPGTPDQYVIIESGVDPVGGPLLLGLNDGMTEFTPAFDAGSIIFGNPVGVNDDDPHRPATLALAQNYPNPFNPQTTIEFSLARPGKIRLDIYNLLGQRIGRLAEGFYQPGTYSVVWDAVDKDGVDLPSGVYFYSLLTDSEVRTGKMTLLR